MTSITTCNINVSMNINVVYVVLTSLCIDVDWLVHLQSVTVTQIYRNLNFLNKYYLLIDTTAKWFFSNYVSSGNQKSSVNHSWNSKMNFIIFSSHNLLIIVLIKIKYVHLRLLININEESINCFGNCFCLKKNIVSIITEYYFNNLIFKKVPHDNKIKINNLSNPYACLIKN